MSKHDPWGIGVPKPKPKPEPSIPVKELMKLVDECRYEPAWLLCDRIKALIDKATS